MEHSHLKYRDLLLNLICEKDVLSKLFEGDKKYVRLLQELKKYDVDDENPLPLQKDLLEVLEMSRTQLINLMEGLYQDFKIKLFNSNAYPISDTKIWLFVNTRNDYWPIGINNLEFIPRKGDDFTVEFVGELWDARYLTVESIAHEIENGLHRINIHVEEKSYE